MDKPAWLPAWVASNYCRMIRENLLSENEKLFFTDERLRDFWSKVGQYLTYKTHQGFCQDASAFFVGAFLNPLAMYGEKTGTAARPVLKVQIRTSQKKADVLFDEAARLAGELALVLENLESTTRFYPDEMWLMPVVRQLIPEPLNDLLPPSEFVHAHQALRVLEKAFLYYPRTGDLFNEIPGMASQKASWRDWLREARGNIQTMLDIYPGKFIMREKDWVNLVQVLIDKEITRSAVQAALKNR